MLIQRDFGEKDLPRCRAQCGHGLFLYVTLNLAGLDYRLRKLLTLGFAMSE